jgi:hypothetical protein
MEKVPSHENGVWGGEYGMSIAWLEEDKHR